MKGISENIKIKNISLEILRMILCFWIVIVHTCKVNNNILNNIKNSKFHVPTFMTMSFYFFYQNLNKRNIAKIKLRFERLLIPYIIWPILIIIINNLLFLFNFRCLFGRYLGFYDLLLQYVFGRHINPNFWFHFHLLFITLIFSIISYIFKNRLLFILSLLIIISYILQYSKLNYNFFRKYNNFTFRNIGSIVEIIPFAVTGSILGFLNIIKMIKNKNNYFFFISIIIIYFLLRFKIFNNISGFRYPGINLNIGSIFVFLGFSVIPAEKIKNQNILKFIKCLTSHTGGIYYLHAILFNYLSYKFEIIKKKSFLGSLILYLLNYIICFIGTKLFHKNKLIYLFN